MTENNIIKNENFLNGAVNILQKNSKLEIITEFNPSALTDNGTDPESFLDLVDELGFFIYYVDDLYEKITYLNRDELLKQVSIQGHVNLLLTKEEKDEI
jgi:hypothetical protein